MRWSKERKKEREKEKRERRKEERKKRKKERKLPRLEYSGASQVQMILSRVAGTTGVCHNAQLIFVFLVKTGFGHIRQTGIECPTSSDQSALSHPKCWDYRHEPPCPA